MEYTLLEILEAREQRVQRQQALLAQFSVPLLSFTLNIPGPDKTGELAGKGFQLGCRLLKRCLKEWNILHFEQRCAAAGWEAFYCIDAPAEALKKITAHIEDTIIGGRVFDMDILTPDCQKLNRESLGLPRRKCLLCREDAVVCGRSRSHDLKMLCQKTFSLLEDGICEEISRLAVQSLLCEVYATPKPGLVDQNNSGSHKDMDLMLFLRSAGALWPYFRRCAKIGLAGGAPSDVFALLRQAGLEAEQVMLRATGGINTHKGAIFALGILCGAVAMLPPDRWEDPAAVSAQAAALAHGLIEKDFGSMGDPVTEGEKLFDQYDITGARGQAEAGFPAALHVGLSVLEYGLSKGLSFNDSLCATLLHIMTADYDTNLIKRGGIATCKQIQSALQTLLQADPLPGPEIIAELDQAFIRKNLSPGGSADLLSATCFFYFLKHP